MNITNELRHKPKGILNFFKRRFFMTNKKEDSLQLLINASKELLVRKHDLEGFDLANLILN